MQANEPLPGLLATRLTRMVDVRRHDLAALCWAFVYFFSLLCSYYIVRPMRDEMGVAGGVRNLPWLFSGTLLVMLLANPPFAALVAKLPRARFVALTYRFFALNLLVFLAVLLAAQGEAQVWAGRVFYIWTEPS